MSVGRKVFQCVVDDTALTSSVGELKKWTSQGAITLVVPLYSKFPSGPWWLLRVTQLTRPSPWTPAFSQEGAIADWLERP